MGQMWKDGLYAKSICCYIFSDWMEVLNFDFFSKLTITDFSSANTTEEDSDPIAHQQIRPKQLMSNQVYLSLYPLY